MLPVRVAETDFSIVYDSTVTCGKIFCKRLTCFTVLALGTLDFIAGGVMIQGALAAVPPYFLRVGCIELVFIFPCEKLSDNCTAVTFGALCLQVLGCGEVVAELCPWQLAHFSLHFTHVPAVETFQLSCVQSWTKIVICY